MKRLQVSVGPIVVILLSLSLLALLGACAQETAPAYPRPAYGSIAATTPAKASTQVGGELNAVGSGTLWVGEAFGGVVVVLGLSEALRRRSGGSC